MNLHEKFMQRCLDLAGKGLGNVAPNPLVGCVIVHEGKIIGEGFHQKYGEAHAEVNAIHSVQNKELLKSSTLYVTLEPCSHFGKTPPCADLIIEHKIPHVVISSKDPFPEVSGKGIEKLINAGIKVETDIFKSEYEWLNRRFFTFQNKKRPYVILKWAQTEDGFIDIDRNNNMPNITWITNETCRILVHKWRTEEQAILIGTNTAVKDNPLLTARSWPGKNPLRIVLDRKLTLPQTLNIFNNEANTLVFTEMNKNSENNMEYTNINFDSNIIPDILNQLYKRGIQSLIVEGGAKTLQSFIDSGLWDEARVFTGNIQFKSGIRAPNINSNSVSSEIIGNSKLEVFTNNQYS